MDIVSLFNFCRDKCTLFFKSSKALHNNDVFDILSIELQGRIVKTFFNVIIHEDDETLKYSNQKKLKRYILKTPLKLGIQFVREFYDMQNMCQYKIGGKKFIAQELFCLPRKQRDIFIRLGNCSYFPSKLGGDISDHDYGELIEIENKDTTKGLKVHLLRGNKILSYMESIGIVTCYGTFSFVTPFLACVDEQSQKLVLFFLLTGIIGGGAMAGVAHMLMKPEHRGGRSVQTITL